MFIDDWNGKAIEAARSRGGVLALARVRDGIIDAAPWPPASIVQKLYKSRQARSFDIEEAQIVTSDLGYYCDLQSVHSEDVITYNFFEIIGEQSVPVLNWILERLGIEGDNTECEVSCWRRIPHPDTLVSGGPELDALLVGDRSIVAVEAKWRSGEGRGQGKDGTKTQLQLRSEWFTKHGKHVFGDRKMIVLGVSAFDDDLVMPLPDAPWALMATMSWRDLTGCRHHPHIDEYTRYYRWKVQNSDWAARRGAPLV